MTFNPLEGDPKLILGPNGVTLQYQGGQPVMDQGLENQALVSLFTAPGWCGNAFLPEPQRIGSTFEADCRGAITLSKLADIKRSALEALDSPAFPSVGVEARNPESWDVSVEVTLGPGTAPLSTLRQGGNWVAQANYPASRRVK